MGNSRCWFPVSRRKEPPHLSPEERKLWQQIAGQVSPIKKKPRREELPPPEIKRQRHVHHHKAAPLPVMPVRQAWQPFAIDRD